MWLSKITGILQKNAMWFMPLHHSYVPHTLLRKILDPPLTCVSWLGQGSIKVSLMQGRCSGETACLPPMWPGFNSRTRRHMWVEFVGGSCPCTNGFSLGSPIFLLPQKPTHRFQFNLEMRVTLTN